jgi:hypothetical protein
MAAAINEQASAVDVGSVHPLFQLRARLNRRYMYDASADGQRFLVNTLVEEATEQPIARRKLACLTEAVNDVAPESSHLTCRCTSKSS